MTKTSSKSSDSLHDQELQNAHFKVSALISLVELLAGETLSGTKREKVAQQVADALSSVVKDLVAKVYATYAQAMALAHEVAELRREIHRPRWVTVKEAAAEWRCTERTIRKWAAEGLITTTGNARGWRVDANRRPNVRQDQES